MPGRRRTPGRNVPIAFDAEVVEALDETAHDLVMGRSTLVNRICRNWLEEYQIPASASGRSGDAGAHGASADGSGNRD